MTTIYNISMFVDGSAHHIYVVLPDDFDYDAAKAAFFAGKPRTVATLYEFGAELQRQGGTLVDAMSQDSIRADVAGDE